MSWWGWVLFVLGSLVVFGLVSLELWFRTTPEGREDARRASEDREIRRRMKEEARRARKKLYEDRVEEIRAEIRREP